MAAPVSTRQRVVNAVFDLRGTIAVLFSIYGVVCIIWGLAFTSGAERVKSGGDNVNLWAGVGMTVFAVVFWVWVFARPEIAEAPAQEVPSAARKAPRR